MNVVHIGDCRDILKTLPEKSIHCCVTSPPYFGLRSYCTEGSAEKDQEIGTEKTPEEYVNNLVEVFREVKRVLRDDGTVFLNIGDSYSGGGRGGGPKHKKESNSAENTSPSYKGIPSKNLIGIPWKVAFALQEDGWILRQEIIWNKNNCMPEAVKDRCTKSHESIFLLTKSPKYFFDNEAIKEPCSENSIKDFKRRKTLDNKGNYGGVRPDLGRARNEYMLSNFMKNKRSVWDVNTKPYKGAHFATFPTALVSPCILAGTSEYGVCSKCGSPYIRVMEKTGVFQRRWSTNNADGSPYNKQDSMQKITETIGWKPTCACNSIQCPATALDPFAGSGTVGEVCRNLNRDSILIDLNPEYEPLLNERGGVNEVTLTSF